MSALWNRSVDIESDESTDGQRITTRKRGVVPKLTESNQEEYVHTRLSAQAPVATHSSQGNGRNMHRQNKGRPYKYSDPANYNYSSKFQRSEGLNKVGRKKTMQTPPYIEPRIPNIANAPIVTNATADHRKTSEQNIASCVKPRYSDAVYTPTVPNASSKYANNKFNPTKKHKNKLPNIIQQAEPYDLPRVQNEMKKKDGLEEVLQPNSAPKVRILGWKKLNELVEKPSNEVLLSLTLPTSGLKEFLEKCSGNNREMMAVFLLVLSKCCDSLHRGNLSSLLALVSQSKLFMYCALQPYLAGFQNSENNSLHFQSLHALLKFLNTFQDSFPALASEIVPVLLPLFKQTCCTVFSETELENIKEQIEQLVKQQQQFITDHTKVDIIKAVKLENRQAVQPPENYRVIPVLPTRKDITEIIPFLRENIIEGKFDHGEHYLDVQFRLLREDYIRPLREGIAAYKRAKSQEKPTSKNKDVRIYENVHITHQEFLHGSLIHIAVFDSKNFAHVNWEHSKRFLTGSLLCFSSNDFETFIFASVASRDSEKLKKGILILKFEEITPEVLSISPVESFVMLETSAYFEAYRHNLAALLDITEDSLPFKKYIVNIDNNVDCPPYLSKSTIYDFGQLFHKVQRDYLLTDVPKVYVNVLDELLWPPYCEFGFDLSQFKAFQAAITKEFSIIQGPPGTGKTYVGLRIVQLLLHNASKWNVNENSENRNPILIVCYTNHALDQFLEGIESFTTNIVRIGGRCANVAIEKYKLANLKKTVRQKREVPHHIFSNVRHQYAILDQLKLDVNGVMKDIKKAYSSLLLDFELESLMSENHYLSLKRFATNEKLDDSFSISNWLNIHSQGCEEAFGFNAKWLDDTQDVNVVQGDISGEMKLNPQLATNFRQANNIVDVRQESDEDDIDFIEGMRDVDTEDFSHLPLNFVTNGDQRLDELSWQIQGGQQDNKQFITAQLQDAIPLLDTEVDLVQDIWRLSMRKRWRLYKFWVQQYVKEKQIVLVKLQTEIQKEFQKLNEMRTEEDLYLMKKACIVAMTTTGAAKYRDLVCNIKPKIVVIEEAAEILEAHIITTLVQETQHLILIGDHQQLRPNPNVYELAVKYNMNVSLFERLIKNKIGYCRLTSQHRMRPAIAKLLVPHIYPDLSNHESVEHFEDIKGVAKNVFFVAHKFIEGHERDSASHVNDHEAKFIVKLCKYFLLQGYDSSQITILTTYSGQLFVLRRLAKIDVLQGVRITVVDNFQGEENDIILISFVRSNEEGNIGFLKVSNRVCVALSRAKKGLFCIGNFNLLATNSSVWENIITTLKKQDAIGESLRLLCQNHPNVATEVSSEQDFYKVPEGGCMLPCEYRLNCGHTCSRTCHSYDREHEMFQCKKKCGKRLCQLGHECKKFCFKDCGPCIEKVLKILPTCLHETLVPCHVNPQDFICPDPCPKQLPCGHNCKRPCGQNCLPESCDEKVEVLLLCNHKQIVACSRSHKSNELLSYCNEPCHTMLDCSHMCVGTCGDCHQKRVHITCRSRCNRILVCGHECKSPCSMFCPPCKEKCENRCQHSKCPKKCGEPCHTCTEPCTWSCEHMKCDKLCGEFCSRPPCDQPCVKKLFCGHPCLGMCGEPCPRLCDICDSKSDQREIFFGTEEDNDARFVQLEDCGHVLEVEGFTHWMNRPLENAQIQMKRCPKCNTVIRKNLRFGNIVKSSLSTIEQVKQKIFGNKKENESRKQVLLKKANDLKLYHGTKQLLNPLVQCLEKRKAISNPFITTCENILNIAEEFLVIQTKIPDFFSRFGTKSIKPNKLSTFLLSTQDLIFAFIQKEYLTASSQQIRDVTRELLRFKAQAKTLKFFDENKKEVYRLVSNATSTDLDANLLEVSSCLTKLQPFNDKDEQQFQKCFEKMVQSCGGAVINVSVEEKKLILKAMNLSQGHWYQCPNGHVYCITECGGAMIESKCNECNAKIGGGSHTLRSDNSVATDMDGAQHAAWSETANMQNYVF